MPEKREWWKNPLRVIQTNLQVRDTDKIIPRKLAQQVARLDANALVFNVGGIYAWYDTKLQFHYKNQFLPQKGDLLKEVIDECHKRGVKFIARFDFSKASDYIYQTRPEWFVRDKNGEPEVLGSMRPGEWSLLMSTCINGAYRTGGLAIPALDEVLSNYEIDGIFYNAPNYIPCWCENCRKKYRKLYGKELPDSSENYEKDWETICYHDNTNELYSFIKNKRPDVPVILYYGIHGDHIMRNSHSTDMICTEAQNILSRGWTGKPPVHLPSLIMKVGRAFDNLPYPFGIIHSSPGMDWRHTGLPVAEYLPWLGQIPANGGYIWHSLTGIPDTIGDKRILDAVAWVDKLTKKIEPYMDGAEFKAETALLWNGNAAALACAEALMGKQIQFMVLLHEQITAAALKKYRLVIIPEGWTFTAEQLQNLKNYVKDGGKILLEGRLACGYAELADMLGILPEVFTSEKLAASYVRFEGADNPLQKGLEQVELIEHRGYTAYCTPQKTARVLATLVPPFSPLESVGAPPERASIPVPHTDIPLAIRNTFGKGECLYLPFSLSLLISEFKLEEHCLFLANAVHFLLGGQIFIRTTSYQGLQVTAFAKKNQYLIHFVNESGSRPLQQTLPLHDISVTVRPDGAKRVKSVKQLFSGRQMKFSGSSGEYSLTIPRLDVWEAVLIEVE